MALSPNGKMIAERGQVWDVASGRELKPEPPEGSSNVQWVAFAPDGATYAETLAEAAGITIHRYDTSDWSAIDTTVIDYRPAGGGSDLADGRFFFSGDGRQVISTLTYTYGNEIAQVLDVPGFNRAFTIAEPRPFWAGPAVFSPDGSWVATRLGVPDQNAVWRATDLADISRSSPATQFIAFLGNGMIDTLRPPWLYDSSSGQKLAIAPAVWPAISPDGRLAVTKASPQPFVTRLADLTTQAVLDTTSNRLPPMHGQNEYGFSRDNRFLAMVADYGPQSKLMVFDASTGQVVTTVAGSQPIAIATMPNGAGRLAGMIDATTFRVWSVPGGTALFDIAGATAVDFSSDGSLIAATGSVGIRIFGVNTGALRETLPAHVDRTAQRSGVNWVAFSPTGQIASVGMDETMRLWCSP